MADIQELIQKIVSDPKIATNSNFASKVYNDEPILFTAPQMEKFTPPRIREMRKLARENASEAKIFHDQGKFMESFEDDCVFRGDFVQYFPTYQAMTDAQLRGYFTWRTRMRKGTVERTALSFVFMYIYELLNQIGVHSPEEGFHALKNFWTVYREIDPRVNAYVTLWLKDYVVYNDLDKSFLEGLPDIAFDNAVSVLLDHKSHGPDAIFSALNAISSYDLENSKFFKQYPDDVKNAVHRVFGTVSDYYNRNPKNSAREKLFGRLCSSSYSMFKSAVFHHRTLRRSFVYEISDCHKYICQNGLWSCERFVWYGNNNKRIGALLKTVDFFMRQGYGYKSGLQCGKTNKILTGKVEKEIAKFREEKLRSTPKEIAIDVSRLHGIRAAAQVTRDKLLVEEPEEAPPPAAPAEQPSARSDAGLDENETMLVRCLLYGGQYDAALRSKGLMLSVLVDGINEKLFDAFGDTAIVDDGDGPKVLEDYEEELKGMLPQ